ncbi:alpha/beta hydrolase [Poritiphilus flavus]|uniref:Alpha/beta fold hydrolase n=1 Tax=Poritiphilus flavus TaxID=2697053 RepID=A0A6L9EFX0_9FLAO|nr:alpha/beta fold hydrolase [Poritiphilus flavus]NAS13637.1 alpha/beta fold hydrolase [Poritiphilus flavus]
MPRLKKFGLAAFSGYLIIAAMLYLLQERLIFLPTKLPADYQFSFTQPFQEVFLKAGDEALLNGIHFTLDNPRGVILYFHGNAGDLSRWGQITSFFTTKGYEVIVMDYRTYGKSTGKLSEAVLYTDAALFYNYAQSKFPEDKIIVYGRSLGTGIASKIASLNNPSKLILETPYYSLEDVGKSRFPWLPVKLLSRYAMRSYEFVAQVNCPITILHGTRDQVVPFESGEKLFEAIPGKQKKMIVIEGGGHNNLAGYEAYQNAINAILLETN